MRANQLLIHIGTKTKGDAKAMLDIIREKRPFSLEEVEETNKSLKSKAFTIVDPCYPKSFHECHFPPICMFYKGNLDLIRDYRKCCTIVGSRMASEYAIKRVGEIAEELAKRGITIVSGLAKGIDGAALRAAAPYGKAVAVLGNGLDYHYPSENRDLQDRIAKEGLLMTEYPEGVAPKADHFPCRNRILAALGSVVFIGEAHAHSGTIVTVAHALDLNRDVAVLPFRATDGTMNNHLIADGATLAETADDIMDMMNFGYQKAEDEDEEK